MARKRIIVVCTCAAIIAAGMFAVNFDAIVNAINGTATKTSLTLPPPGNPFRMDSEPIPVKMGNRYLLIPANVLDSPPDGGREGKFYVDDGTTLIFSWPTMQGRTKENWEEMATSVPGGWRAIETFIFSRKNHDDTSRRLLERFRSRIGSSKLSLDCIDPLDASKCPELYEGADAALAYLSDTRGLRHFERYDRKSHDRAFMSDVFLEIERGDLTSFYVCNRPSSARPGKVCTEYFVADDYEYNVIFNFERITTAEWRSVREAVVRRIAQFERDGAAFRKASENPETH